MMNSKPGLLAATAAAVFTLSVAHAAPQYFPHAVPPGAQALPFSDAVGVSDTVYVSGHLGIDPKTGQARPIARSRRDSFWIRCRRPSPPPALPWMTWCP
jgi:enamine deaminase RidA (YjgF/YER057c/UK114 family)